jgi:hypothetical protein
MNAAVLHSRLTGQIDPAQEKQYLLVPFTVPAAAARIAVDLAYSEQISSDPTLAGGNTLDLGIFDQRGVGSSGVGYRGWSGSERLSVFLAEDTAAPGYTAGPLLPGAWNVVLGLYKIGPRGCTYTLDITVTLKDAAAAAGASTAVSTAGPGSAGRLLAGRLPAGSGPWYRGDLHCHTWHSDGAGAPAEVAARARANGLDFLAVTDHNSSAAWADLLSIADPGLALIAGVEVTTFHGHFNAWGITDFVDFRVTAPAEMAAALAFARERGALTSCGHPKPFGPNWDFTEAANYDCVEIWNGPWTGLNEVSLHFWLEQLAAGRRIPAVGGSDYHRPGETAGGSQRDLGTPTNWVYAPNPLEPGAILQAVRAGRLSISDRPDGPFLALSGGQDGAVCMGGAMPAAADGTAVLRVTWREAAGLTLRLLDENGEVKYSGAPGGGEETLTVAVAARGSRCVYAELRSAEEKMRAVTNPIYFETGPA